MRKRDVAAKCILSLFSTLLLAPVLEAAEPVRGMSFFPEALVIEAVPGKQQYQLIVMPQPGISSPVYALRGMIRYKDVEGDAYLQLNNDFGDNGVFFTKSLAPSGPLGKISGTSEWRPFALPFYVNQGDMAGAGDLVPVELTLSLHLPGSGSVAIRNVRLFQYAANEDPLSSPDVEGYSLPNPQFRLVLNIFIALLFVAALLLYLGRNRGGRAGP